MASPTPQVNYKMLKQALADGLDTFQAAERFQVLMSNVRYRCRLYGIALRGMNPPNLQAVRHDIIQRELDSPDAPVLPMKRPKAEPEAPPSRALIALAAFDKIASKALARKMGAPVLEEPVLEEED